MLPAERSRGIFFLVLTALFGAAGALSVFKVIEPDAFWHLATGRAILEKGALIHTNFFSATFPDYPWENFEWLFQVLLALVHGGYGWTGVAVMKVLFVFLTAVVIYGALMTVRRAPLEAFSLTLLALACMRFRFTERPHLASLLFFAYTVFAVQRYRMGSRRILWTLAPLFLVWANVHPEFTGALVYLAAALFGIWLDAFRKNEATGREALMVAGIFVLTILFSLVNPYGYRTLLSPLLVPGIGPIMEVSEWSRSTISNAPFYWPFVLLTALVMASARARRSWADILPLVPMVIVGGLYTRATTFFVIAAAPVVHAGLGSAPWAAGVTLRRLFTVSAAAAALIWSTFFSSMLDYQLGLGPARRYAPEGAVRFLTREGLPGNLYNHYNLGGYLIFSLYPKMKVFQDGRFQPYPREFMRRLHGGHTGENWRGLFDDYGINTALVRAAEFGVLFPRETWGVVYWDEEYAVLLRRSAENQGLLDRLEYRYFYPGSNMMKSGRISDLLSLESEMTRNQREHVTSSARLLRDRGFVLGKLRRYSEAEVELQRAVALIPDDVAAWAYLGRAQAKMGKIEEARAALDTALRLDPGNERTRKWLSELPSP